MGNTKKGRGMRARSDATDKVFGTQTGRNMAKVPISVCIIAKNEEKYIEGCLRQVLPYGMEIVVVDTGSTDNTKQIAQKYTDHVYDFTWVGDFSAARNFAASKASNNWILVLDCDEYIQELDMSKLRMCMQKYAKNVGVINILNVYIKDGKESMQPNEVPRFYNRNYYDYRFRIHEQITPKKAVDFNEVVLETFRMPLSVKHYGYDISDSEMMKKQERNLELLKASIGENEGMDDYLYFQIGQSYNVLHNYEQAILAYDMSLEINTNPEKKFLIICLESYADCLMKADRNEDAYKLLDINRDYLKTTRLWYLFGKAAYLCKNFDIAYINLTKVTEAEDIALLGDDVFDVYERIFAICNAKRDVQKLEFYKNKLIAYGNQHGKKIFFE